MSSVEPLAYPHLEQTGFEYSCGNAVSTLLNDVYWPIAFPGRVQKINNSAMQVFSAMGCLSLCTGGILFYNGKKAFDLSEKLKDIEGRISGFFCMATGFGQMLGGATYLGMSLASLSYWFTRQKTALAASNILQNLGSGLLSVASLLGAVVIAAELKFAIECKLSLKEANFNLREAVLDPKQGLLWRKTLSAELLKDITEKTELSQEALDLVQAELNKRLLMYSAIGFLSIAGIVLGILSLVSTPIAPWMLGVAGLVLGLAWLALDAVDLLENLQDPQVQPWEKVALYGMTFFSTGIVVVGTLLTREPVFSAISALMGTILVLVQLTLIYNMKTSE